MMYDNELVISILRFYRYGPGFIPGQETKPSHWRLHFVYF